MTPAASASGTGHGFDRSVRNNVAVSEMEEAKAMHGDVDDVLRQADRAAIQAKLADLRAERDALDQQIAMREEFLSIMDRWEGREPAATSVPSPSTRTVPVPMQERVATQPPTNPKERREAILAVMRRQPGTEWSTDAIRAELDKMGVSFEGGTPLKGLLFRLMQSGIIERPRIGVYKLPATGRDNGHVEQEAPGL